MIIGCDIGTSRTKAVLLDGTDLRARAVVPTLVDPDGAVARAIERLYQEAGIAPEAATTLVATGWGQLRLRRAHESASMVNCLAKAAHWAVPGARSAVCMGTESATSLAARTRARSSGSTARSRQDGANPARSRNARGKARPCGWWPSS